MHQQHATGQTRRGGDFLLEVEQHVAWIFRVEIPHLVAKHELIGEIHQAVGAVGLWRGLGDQTLDAAAPVAGDVVPDDLDTAGRDRERDGRIEVFQTTAATDQLGGGGILLIAANTSSGTVAPRWVG